MALLTKPIQSTKDWRGEEDFSRMNAVSLLGVSGGSK